VLSDIIYGLIFAPSATFKKIGEDKPVILSLLVFLVISVINLPLYRGILLHQNTVSIMHKAQWFWILGWMGIFFSFLVLFFLAGLYSLLSEIIFKKGNAVGILACFGFAAFPGVIGSACQYGALLLDFTTVGFLCSFLAILWMIALQILALREALDIQSGQAILLFLSPGFLLLIFLLLVLWVSYAAVSLIK